MSGDAGDHEELRRALALHLEELRRDGLWGLSTSRLVVTRGVAAGAAGRGHGRQDDTPGGDAAGRQSSTITAGEPGRANASRDGEPGDSSAPGGPSRVSAAAAAHEPRREHTDDAAPPPAGLRREADLFDAVEASASPADASLEEIRPEVEGCTLCRLCETRTNVVFGVGDPDAELMFIGEGPGRDEDLQGEPFVGRAGQLLDRIIAAMGRTREDVYIANAVKCRPPQNRNPRDDELASCLPYLHRQVAVIRPRVIVLLGKVAVQSVLGLDAPLSRLRGRFHAWRGIDVMCTYHPAYLLRNPSAKRMVWEDMQQVMRRLSGEL